MSTPLFAASLGHEAVGVDIAPRAVELARAKAAERKLEVRFVVFDALRLSELGEQFDTVLDRGVPWLRRRGAGSVRGQPYVDRPRRGRYQMLCFSERQPGDWGPRRITQDEIRASFTKGWAVDSIESAVLEVTIDPAGAQA